MYGRPQGDQGVFANTFSDDSLGDSTRSLLSPVFHGDGGRVEPSELSEGSLSSGDETDKESLHQSRNGGKDYSLDFERSYTSDKPRANGYTTPIASNSFSRHKSSSRKSTSSASRSNTKNHKSGKTGSSKTAEVIVFRRGKVGLLKRLRKIVRRRSRNDLTRKRKPRRVSERNGKGNNF